MLCNKWKINTITLAGARRRWCLECECWMQPVHCARCFAATFRTCFRIITTAATLTMAAVGRQKKNAWNERWYTRSEITSAEFYTNFDIARNIFRMCTVRVSVRQNAVGTLESTDDERDDFSTSILAVLWRVRIVSTVFFFFLTRRTE